MDIWEALQWLQFLWRWLTRLVDLFIASNLLVICWIGTQNIWKFLENIKRKQDEADKKRHDGKQSTSQPSSLIAYTGSNQCRCHRISQPRDNQLVQTQNNSTNAEMSQSTVDSNVKTAQSTLDDNVEMTKYTKDNNVETVQFTEDSIVHTAQSTVDINIEMTKSVDRLTEKTKEIEADNTSPHLLQQTKKKKKGNPPQKKRKLSTMVGRGQDHQSKSVEEKIDDFTVIYDRQQLNHKKNGNISNDALKEDTSSDEKTVSYKNDNHDSVSVDGNIKMVQTTLDINVEMSKSTVNCYVETNQSTVDDNFETAHSTVDGNVENTQPVDKLKEQTDEAKADDKSPHLLQQSKVTPSTKSSFQQHGASETHKRKKDKKKSRKDIGHCVVQSEEAVAMQRLTYRYVELTHLQDNTYSSKTTVDRSDDVIQESSNGGYVIDLRALVNQLRSTTKVSANIGSLGSNFLRDRRSPGSMVHRTGSQGEYNIVWLSGTATDYNVTSEDEQNMFVMSRKFHNNILSEQERKNPLHKWYNVNGTKVHLRGYSSDVSSIIDSYYESPTDGFMYRRCKLNFDNPKMIEAKPVDKAFSETVYISSRRQCGRAFNEDEVVLHILNREHEQRPNLRSNEKTYGKVAAVVKRFRYRDIKHPIFVCTMDEYQSDIMLPVCKTVWKVKALRRSPTLQEHLIVDIYQLSVATQTITLRESLAIPPDDKYLYRFVVCILKWEARHLYPLGAILDVFRVREEDINSGIRCLALQHKVPILYKKETVRKVEETCKKPRIDMKYRTNLSETLDVYTIDSKWSKDLDDGLSIDTNKDGSFRVGVHITDVTSVVERGSSIDTEASKRCTTYYSGGSKRTFNMLPEPLSEDLLSLLPGQQRASLSVFFNISSDGICIGTPDVQKTIIRSSRKLTYLDVQRLIMSPQVVDEKYISDIDNLFFIATAMRKNRLGNAMHCYPIEHDVTPEEEKCLDIYEAKYLVEEYMNLTNRHIHDLLTEKFPNCTPVWSQHLPNIDECKKWKFKHSYVNDAILRLQPPENYEQDRQFVGIVGESEQPIDSLISVRANVWNDLVEKIDTQSLRLTRQVVGADEQHPIQAIAVSEWIRFQEKGQYACSGTYEDDERNGTFYMIPLPRVHFTSPIRRYIDIIAQRLVHAVLDGCTTAPYTTQDIINFCERQNEAAKQAKAYQKQCRVLSMAHDLQNKPLKFVGMVNELSRRGFVIQIPGMHEIQKREICYKSLDVCSVPKLENTASGISPIIPDAIKEYTVVDWRKRLYHYQGRVIQGRTGVKRIYPYMATTFIYYNHWLNIVQASLEGDTHKSYDILNSTTLRVNVGTGHNELRRQIANTVTDVSSEVENDVIFQHSVQFKMWLYLTQTVCVQMNAKAERGLLQPSIQLLDLTDTISFCLQHTEDPVTHLAKCTVTPSQERYRNINEYLQIWLPILEMEAVTNIIRDKSSATISNVQLSFSGREGKIIFGGGFCDKRDIQLNNWTLEGFPLHADAVQGHLLYSAHYLCIRCPLQKESIPKRRTNTVMSEICNRRFWVGHGSITQVINTPLENLQDPEKRQFSQEVIFQLHQKTKNPPFLSVKPSENCTIELLLKSVVDRHTETVLKYLHSPDATNLAEAIALGTNMSLEIEARHRNMLLDFPEDVDIPGLNMVANNEEQGHAINEALTKRFSLIQGPPGTGKSYTGMKLIYLYDLLNTRIQQHDPSSFKQKVIYCGPSNKSVDLVARWVFQKLNKHSPKMIRVYGQHYENVDFPIPGKAISLGSGRKDSKPDRFLVENNLVLHHNIRLKGKRHANEIRQFDNMFRLHKERVSLEDLQKYSKLIKIASIEELKSYDVIFCTTATVPRPTIMRATGDSVNQLIIDEAGMCTEPESMVPIIATKAKQVVLIGDHKQLQPIIINKDAAKLGLEKSIFERYAEGLQQGSCCLTMLKKQYRMNPYICQFPSDKFYNGKVITGDNFRDWYIPIPLKMWRNSDPMNHTPLAFVHIEGQEEALTVTTDEGNDRSVSNKQEAEYVVKLFLYMVTNENVDITAIQIITQYNAQRHIIQEALAREHFPDTKVNTVVSSQGGEWDYVIFSSVRSLPKYLIEPSPAFSWRCENMGFITDVHQINVALTRARKGHIIVGNKHLMRCDPVWSSLIDRYGQLNCVFTPDTFPPSLPEESADHDNPQPGPPPPPGDRTSGDSPYTFPPSLSEEITDNDNPPPGAPTGDGTSGDSPYTFPPSLPEEITDNDNPPPGPPPPPGDAARGDNHTELNKPKRRRSRTKKQNQNLQHRNN